MNSILVASSLVGGIILLIVALLTIKWVLTLRRVVETNEVHIVQGTKGTTSYGRGQEQGNTYYSWPSWIPFIGVQVTRLPLSMFEISLTNYEAYDNDKVPFVVDITAFLQVVDANTAAQSIFTIEQFNSQMKQVVQGSVRAILGANNINKILIDRKDLSIAFTDEVRTHLKAWGVATAKNIEFMDIRDSKDSNVIENIRAEKVTEIEMNSRIKVAQNHKEAALAEIKAKQETDLREEEAKQLVGTRQAQVAQEVGIAKEKSEQSIKEQAKVTAEKQVEVMMVEQVGSANIIKETSIIKAEQDKSVLVKNAEANKENAILAAEASKQTQQLTSEGLLKAKENEALGVAAIGKATAEAIEAKGLAEIKPQVELADKVGSNKEYQDFMIRQQEVTKDQAIGVAQADALGKSDMKIIANSGDVVGGIKSLGDAFSAKGGTQIAAMLEGFIQTEAGEALISKVIGNIVSGNRAANSPTVGKK